MAPLDPSELWPEALARVQLRGRDRQVLEMEAWRRSVGQNLLVGLLSNWSVSGTCMGI
jgi:hypothetical protein